MERKMPPPEGYDENPEWTEGDFAAAKPAREILPEGIVAALVKSKGGRPTGSNKEQVSLRIDKDVITLFRAAGRGWQGRMNDALRRAVGL